MKEEDQRDSSQPFVADQRIQGDHIVATCQKVCYSEVSTSNLLGSTSKHIYFAADFEFGQIIALGSWDIP